MCKCLKTEHQTAHRGYQTENLEIDLVRNFQPNSAGDA